MAETSSTTIRILNDPTNSLSGTEKADLAQPVELSKRLHQRILRFNF